METSRPFIRHGVFVESAGVLAAAWEVQMAQLLVFDIDSAQSAEALHRDHPAGSTDPSAS